MKQATKLLTFALLTVLYASSCKKEISCENCYEEQKQPPIANAGIDSVLELPLDSTLLNGSISRDNDGTIKTWKWNKVAGPADFIIRNATADKTMVVGLKEGVYQFELTVIDNDNLTAKDTVQLTVIKQTGAVYTFVGTPGPCAYANVQGTYTAGTVLTAANKVDILVNVTKAGSYTITSPPVNGMTFSRSGTFTTTGVQSVGLQGTGTPTAAGSHQFPLVTGTSGCAFTVYVDPVSGGGGPTVPDPGWSFNQGTSFFFGPIDFASLINLTGVDTLLIIAGTTYHTRATQDTLFSIYIPVKGSTIQPGTYSTSTSASFDLLHHGGAMGTTIYTASPTATNAVMSVVITSYNSTTRVVQGTFSGNAQTLAGTPVPITNGKFKATVGQ